MTVVDVEGNRVVPIPGIRHRFDGMRGDGSGLQEQCHGVMGVPGCERLEIYSPPGVPVGLRRDDHHVTGVPIGTRSITPSLTGCFRYFGR